MSASLQQSLKYVQAWSVKKAFALSDAQLKEYLDRVSWLIPTNWYTMLYSDASSMLVVKEASANLTFEKKFQVQKDEMVKNTIIEIEHYGTTGILNRINKEIGEVFGFTGGRLLYLKRKLFSSINSINLRTTYEEKNFIENNSKKYRYIEIQAINDNKNYVLKEFKYFENTLFKSLLIDKTEILMLLSIIGINMRKESTGISKYVIDQVTSSNNPQDFEYLFRENIPDGIIALYTDTIGKEKRGRKKLYAYLLDAQGYDKRFIADKLNLAFNASNIRKYIREGERFAKGKELPLLTSYRSLLPPKWN